MIASRHLSEYWGRCRTARFRCNRPTYGLCLRSLRPRANDCAVAHFDIVWDVASATGLSPDEGTGCDCNHRRSIFREITCTELPGPMSTIAIATRHRTNRKKAGA
jgi:hypothetical protein